MAGDTGTMPAGGANDRQADGQAIARQRIAACIATQAEELDLGGLQLTEIPGELVAAAESGQLRHLKRLFLAGNSAVRALDRDTVLAERDALQSILSDFSIETPQSRILINIKSWNALSALPGALFTALDALEELDLAENRLTEVPASISNLTGLTHLDLGYNGIGAEGARALAALTGLTSLNLADNGKIEIDALTALPKLQQITLDNCEIGNVCAEFWYKPSLRQASLRRAKLGDVPGEIIEGDNPLAKLRAHLRDLAAGAELLSDIKFMILGNGRIGKTQICRRLRGEEFDETVDSTHGIFISEATLPQQNADGDTNGNRTPTRLRLWDFGGQDIYLGTHALFLKSRALFPIVWTPASEKRSEHTHNDLTFRNYPLDYWVQYVGHMADRASPLILIQNQVDEPGPPGRPPVSKALLDRFAWHERIDYSAKTKNGHPTLIDTLNQAVAYLRKTQGEQRIGAVRAAVKRRLEAMQQQAQAAREARPQAGEPDLENAWITKTAFDAMCAEEGGVESTDLLLEYLHQIGTVFYRKDLFDGRIVIDQQWALDAIYAVFERNSGAYRYLRDIRGGRFTQSELAAHVWSRLGHGNAEQELFISMMRSCGICFKLHAGDDSREAEYVAPDLLPPRDEIAGLLVRDWDDSDQATERAAFTYALLPPGLMRSLMAKIGEDAGTRADYWQDGFYFYDSKTRSRARVEQIRAEDDGESGWSGRIEVRTQAAGAGAGESNGPRELLRRLCHLIDETQNRHGVTTSEFSGPKWYERLLQPGKAARRHSTLRAAAYGREILDTGDAAEAGVGLMSAPPGMPVPLDERGPPQPPIDPAYEPAKDEEYYVSYAWGGNKTKADRLREKAVTTLCEAAKANGIRIVRDKHDMQFGDSIGQFMIRIAEAQHVFVIMSAKYLRSPYCMYELHEIYRECRRRDDVFRQRVRVIVLPDADIFGPIERIRHAEHWSKERAKLDAEIKRVNDFDIVGMQAFQRRHLMTQFAHHTADILALVADMLNVQRIEDIRELTLQAKSS
ncbi:MAG: COR domain-containing protein [Pseudomonadota bacterium]